MSDITPDSIKYFAASDLCQLLSIFLRLPTMEIVDGIRSGSIAQDVRDIFTELDISESETAGIIESLKAWDKSETPKQLLSSLRREYTRLFTVPGSPKIYIYEALYLHNEDSGDHKPCLYISPAALDAERCYKKAGLERSREINESRDHFAVQMEFMMFLYRELAVALIKDDQDKFDEINSNLQEFERLHLNRWEKSFFERCAAYSKNTIIQAFWNIANVFRNVRPILM